MNHKPKDIIKIIRENKQNDVVNILTETINSENEPQASAETNSLSKTNLQNGDILYFLCSNTPPGKICAQALYQYYQNRCNVQKITIENLKGDKFEQGLRELTDKIVEIIREQKNNANQIIINATGGYKPESTYATLAGILQKVEIKYLHEEFDNLVELPPIPISFDLSLFHRNRIWIELARGGNKEAYNKLSPQLQSLFISTNNSVVITPLGEILWNAYRSTISPAGRKLPEIGLINKLNSGDQKKVFQFIKQWDSLWIGDQVPQMVDHEQNHCQNVLTLADEALIPILEKQNDFLNEKEIYYLISAIFLHDIGHSEIEEGGNLLTLEEIRKKHGELTYQKIKNNYSDFGFKAFNEEANLIATICKYHLKKFDLNNLDEIKQIGDNRIRVRFIVALLRLFDACDCQVSRAGDEPLREMRLRANKREREVCKKLLESNPQGKVKIYLEEKIKFIDLQEHHFQLHSGISLVEMQPEKDNGIWVLKIICHPKKGMDTEKSIAEFEKKINEELNAICVKKTLADNSIKFKFEKGAELVDKL